MPRYLWGVWDKWGKRWAVWPSILCRAEARYQALSVAVGAQCQLVRPKRFVAKKGARVIALDQALVCERCGDTIEGGLCYMCRQEQEKFEGDDDD